VVTSFKVDLHLLRASEGGRGAPLRSGSGGLARFGPADNPGWGVGVTVMFDAPAQLTPGETGLVRMVPWTSTPTPPAGTTVHLYESTRLIGTGTVFD
jgi:hypothetical protein